MWQLANYRQCASLASSEFICYVLHPPSSNTTIKIKIKESTLYNYIVTLVTFSLTPINIYITLEINYIVILIQL